MNDCNRFYNSIAEICEDFPFLSRGKKGSVCNIPCVFDIEASSFYEEENKRCTMYAWVFGMNGKCIRGRTWDEFMDVIRYLVWRYHLSVNKRIIVYVHNLSYEFQWIKNKFTWHKVFSMESRKPIYAITADGIEFRCSYLLSGYNLYTLGENLTKYKVSKLVGDLDYSLIRHSKTPLNEKEWQYILHDGLVVMAHIQEEMERLGDIRSLPLTKTGYVRNLCKENCLKGDDRWEYLHLIKTLTLDVDTYKTLKRAYTGGFTHANVNYVNKTIKNVSSYDFTSSYPTVMISEKYPMTKFWRYFPTDKKDFELHLDTFCCMFDIEFENLIPKVEFENYISSSRCQDIEHYFLNNGRVVEADRIKLTLTEQDYFIIREMYKWDSMKVTNFYYAHKAYLPKELIMTVLQLYKNKTELKGVKGKEVEYLVSKGMINSVYGMCVTDICRDETLFDNYEWKMCRPDLETMIERYNTNRERTLFYAWGVWITAYSRRNLFTGILEFKNDYLYADTDSLKVIHKERHKEYIENYNKEITEKIEKCLKYYDIPLKYAKPKTIKGKEKPLGVWDFEGTYDRFRTLGAKRYITEKDGELQITIAGVSKSAGKEYLLRHFGTIDNVFKNFKENLYFPSEYEWQGEKYCGSGKMCHTYIDCKMQGKVIDYMGNIGDYCEDSGIHLENTDYTMSLSADFRNLIMGIKESHIC